MQPSPGPTKQLGLLHMLWAAWQQAECPCWKRSTESKHERGESHLLRLRAALVLPRRVTRQQQQARLHSREGWQAVILLGHPMLHNMGAESATRDMRASLQPVASLHSWLQG